MNVRDLIEVLKELDPAQEVITRPQIAPIPLKPKIALHVNEFSDSDYVDVDVYIKMPNDPGEWKLRASYVKPTKRFYESEPMYAQTDDAGFDETGDPVPKDVRAEFFNALPQAFDMIREELKKEHVPTT